MLASKAWDARDKASALLIPPFVVVVGGRVVLGGAASVAATVLMASALSGLLSAAYLSHRLRWRRAV